MQVAEPRRKMPQCSLDSQAFQNRRADRGNDPAQFADGRFGDAARLGQALPQGSRSIPFQHLELKSQQ